MQRFSNTADLLFGVTDLSTPSGSAASTAYVEKAHQRYPLFFQVRITHWYVKRYCTEKYVSKFVFYFPYILLIVPLTLVLVDRIFIK